MTPLPKPSNWLWKFLESYERFRPTAYPATAAERKKGIWTLGYGHTKGVREGDTCTMDQAQAWLQEDVRSSLEAIQHHIHVPLSLNELDATASLVFNCGPDPLTHTFGAKLNAGDRAGAAAEFKRWDKQAGKELDGLLKRRVAEAAHFLAPVLVA